MGGPGKNSLFYQKHYEHRTTEAATMQETDLPSWNKDNGALVCGTCSEPRLGKTVYTGVLTTSHPQAAEGTPLALVDQVYRVTIRTTDHEGKAYLFPETEVEVYLTNLYEDPDTVLELYHDHATSEQFHSERKTVMNCERLPS